jgi:hypothetical protein
MQLHTLQAAGTDPSDAACAWHTRQLYSIVEFILKSHTSVRQQPKTMVHRDNGLIDVRTHAVSDLQLAESLLLQDLMTLGFDSAILLISSYANPVDTLQHARNHGYQVTDFMVTPMPFGYYSSEPKVPKLCSHLWLPCTVSTRHVCWMLQSIPGSCESMLFTAV